MKSTMKIKINLSQKCHQEIPYGVVLIKKVGKELIELVCQLEFTDTEIRHFGAQKDVGQD